MTAEFTLPARPDLAIVGSDRRFPVRRIFCVGRNYAAHAQEMGGDERDPPFFFTKFAEDVVAGNGAISYPPATKAFDYEGELVIAIGQKGSFLPVDQALDIVFGYAAGLDMTRRDLVLAARDTGRPWDLGKNFSQSAPLGSISPAAEVGHLRTGALELTVNGAVRQKADLGEMIWNCAEIISHLSHYETLLPGDLIYTGTPAGIGPVRPGDVVEISIAGLEPLRIAIEAGERSGT
jgi:fumarylpyruvate hydrolase